MKSGRWLLIVLLCASFGLPVRSFAQATSSAISGVVRDNSQAVISGAAVVVTNSDTGTTRQATTDAQGRYRVGEMQPGTYQISVAAAGFAKETRRNIVLAVGQEQALNFELQVGAVEQEVTVTSAAPMVETTSASVAALVSQEALRELPLNGRSFTDLITLQTGAYQPTNAAQATTNYGNGPQLSVAGARSDANNFMIDGTDMSGASNNTPGSAAGVQLGVDAIREYQVIASNPKAEYGRNAGAVINAVSRSGTNDLHGSAFEFLRNSALDARQFFDGKSVPPFKRNQFGFTLGGPIHKDKTFYFFAYEGLRQSLSQTFVYNVPTADAHKGILSPPLSTPNAPPTVVQINSRVAPYLALYPLPNGQELGGGVAQYSTPVVQPTQDNFGSGRIDHNFSANDFFFGRYTVDRGHSNTASQFLSNFDLNTTNQYLTLQEDHIFSSNRLNTFRAGFNRTQNLGLPLSVPGGEKLGFTPGQPMGSLNVGGLSVMGPGPILQVDSTQTAFQYSDDLTYTRGAHAMKFGALAERFQWNSQKPTYLQGTVTFTNLQNFLQGGPTGFAATLMLPNSDTDRGIRSTLLGFYAQDDYKVTPNLLLSYGLRWEFTTGMNEVNGKISYLAKGPLVSTLSDLKPGSWQNHIALLEPRLGFNWSPGGNQKTALSGGVGIFHNQLLNNTQVSFRSQLPFYQRGQAFNANASTTFPDLLAVFAFNGIAFSDTRHFDYYNFKSPTMYRANFGVQRQLPGNIVLRVGYVGSLGRHLARRQQLNLYPQPITRPDGSLFFPCGPTVTATCPNPVPQAINPNYTLIEWMSSDVNSSYNALNVSLEKRFSRGLTFKASYTWSKSIDDQSASESNYSGNQVDGEWGPDRSLDRAQSSFNVPQAFVGNWLYELPFGSGKSWLNSGALTNAILGGWQIGGILTVQGGVPMTIANTATYPGYSVPLSGASRPNLKPGVDVSKFTSGTTAGCTGVAAGRKLGTPALWYDPCGFSVPAAGTLGNASRNLLLGPGITTLNFTASKSFPIGERVHLQFRGEFFNLLNHTNFGIPGTPGLNVITSTTGVPSAAAGRITQITGTARQIQFGLKLTF